MRPVIGEEASEHGGFSSGCRVYGRVRTGRHVSAPSGLALAAGGSGRLPRPLDGFPKPHGGVPSHAAIPRASGITDEKPNCS